MEVIMNFKYKVGDEPSPGFVVTDRFVSPISGSPMYFYKDMSLVPYILTRPMISPQNKH